MANAERKNPFDGPGEQWRALATKINKLVKKRSGVVAEIAKKNDRHQESCSQCEKQAADDEQVFQRMEIALNDKIRELRNAHKLEVAAMRAARPQRVGPHDWKPADDVSDHLAERDELNARIARLQSQQDQLDALAPGEELLPQVDPARSPLKKSQRRHERFQAIMIQGSTAVSATRRVRLPATVTAESHSTIESGHQRLH